MGHLVASARDGSGDPQRSRGVVEPVGNDFPHDGLVRVGRDGGEQEGVGCESSQVLADGSGVPPGSVDDEGQRERLYGQEVE